jgi:hypothetical protein
VVQHDPLAAGIDADGLIAVEIADRAADLDQVGGLLDRLAGVPGEERVAGDVGPLERLTSRFELVDQLALVVQRTLEVWIRS